jgi:hypothetical protein
MPVRSVVNQYRGVNAHLHSFWQGAGKWNRFHNAHVTELMHTLKAQLLPMGYTAEIEESLQIWRVGDEPYRPVADVLITDLDPQRPYQRLPGNGSRKMSVAELVKVVQESDKYYSAIGLYDETRTARPSDAVAWIELLSPSNKRRGGDAEVYQYKRAQLLDEGMVFVEIDYLHETPPTFMRLLDYSNRKHRNAQAHPYRIVVLDPRPDIESGPVSIHEFDVDASIPTVTIPLNAGDAVDFDFGAAYDKTFREGLYGYERNYDYAELPMNFDRYSEADQTRIACRMLAVLEAARDGVDLETGPFPVKEVSLQEALAQIEALKGSLGT